MSNPNPEIMEPVNEYVRVEEKTHERLADLQQEVEKD